MKTGLGRLYLIAVLVILGILGLTGLMNHMLVRISVDALTEVNRISEMQIQAQRAITLAYEVDTAADDNAARVARLELERLSSYFDDQRAQSFAPTGLITPLLYGAFATESRLEAYDAMPRRLALLSRNTRDLAAATTSLDRSFMLSALRAQTRSDVLIDLEAVVSWHQQVLQRVLVIEQAVQLLLVPLTGLAMTGIWWFLVVPLREREASATTRLKQSESEARKLALVAENANDSIAIVDGDGVIEWVNKAFASRCGHARRVLVGAEVSSILDRGARNPDAIPLLVDAIGDGLPLRLDLENARRDGSPFWTELDLVPVGDSDGALRFITIEHDVTERKLDSERLRRANAAVAYRAQHDSLTDLPNRQYLAEHLPDALVEAARTSGRLAVMHLDLDRFKEVNDTLGHAAGDAVLRTVADRVKTLLRPDDFLARIGGDEFILIAPLARGADEARRIGESVISRINEPITFEEKEINVGASVGVALSSDECEDPGQLIINADIALYESKNSGRGSLRIFRSSMGVAYVQRQRLLTELKAAASDRVFEPFYQPQIRLSDNSLVGFELLARWPHPDEGLLAPSRFIEIANDAGLMSEIDTIVLERGLEGLAALRAHGHHVPRVSVNASARSLRSNGYAEWVQFLLDDKNLSPSDLAIEVLEETLITDGGDQAAKTIRRLDAAGFHVELDDFGSGYAAMSNLASMQLSSVKIDRTLVSPLPDKASEAIVRAIVALCHDLGLTVIGEGVETRAHAEILRRLGCDAIQGYAVARPMSWEQANTWLAAQMPPSIEHTSVTAAQT